MIERKNIDKLFQEKFKDFEQLPSDEMWPRIEEKLKEKKKRRVIPIWWKLSGIAAALLIGVFIVNGLRNPKPDGINVENGVVNGTNNPETNNSVPSLNDATSESAVVENDTPKKDIDGVKNPKNEASTSESNSGLVVNDKANEAHSTNSANPNQSVGNKKNQLSPSEQHPIVVNERKSEKNQINQNQSNKKRTVKNQSVANKNQEAIANVNSVSKQSKSLVKNLTEKRDPIQKNSNKSNAEITTKNNADSKLAQTDTQSNTVKTSDNRTTDQNKTIDTPAPNQQLADNTNTQEEKKLDSTAIATVAPNALEELLNEKENNLVTKGPQINRWQITSSVAPIYFGSTSGGSPIDTTFSSNSKQYKTNLSIRLGVNYAINKKFTLRTGVSNVTFDYNTRDVMIYAGMNPNSLPNVNTNGQNQFLHFGRRSSMQSTAATGSNLATDEFNSYLNQRMGFIEVPLELSYALIDKKFGVNIIGGISTLFLNENKILVISDGLTTNLGEANNLNKTHFSSNVGLGVRYRFYRAFQANFEPMFKYQINTFSKDAGNFKPYYFGLYTGISYSF